MGNKKNVVIFGCKNTTRYLINSLAEEIEISHIITISKEKKKTKEVYISEFHTCIKVLKPF